MNLLEIELQYYYLRFVIEGTLAIEKYLNRERIKDYFIYMHPD